MTFSTAMIQSNTTHPSPLAVNTSLIWSNKRGGERGLCTRLVGRAAAEKCCLSNYICKWLNSKDFTNKSPYAPFQSNYSTKGLWRKGNHTLVKRRVNQRLFAIGLWLPSCWHSSSQQRFQSFFFDYNFFKHDFFNVSSNQFTGAKRKLCSQLMRIVSPLNNSSPRTLHWSAICLKNQIGGRSLDVQTLSKKERKVKMEWKQGKILFMKCRFIKMKSSRSFWVW